MKKRIATQTALLLSSLFFATQVMAQTPTKAELGNFGWQDVSLSQKVLTPLSSQQIQAFSQTLAGTKSAVVGYKIPANQGTLKIKISSLVTQNETIFVPNVLVLDANFNESLTYPSSQFKVVEERGLEVGQLQAELSLTPTNGQDFIYLLIYTTEQDLAGKTTFTHPAKLYAKAKGNQPPAIADIEVKHRNEGQIQLVVDGMQSTQFVGLGNVANGGALFETKSSTAQTVGSPTTHSQAVENLPKNAKSQTVEKTTEQYFNDAVKIALKKGDINKAMNLVNEAEKLGLTQPRQIFLQKVSSK